MIPEAPPGCSWLAMARTNMELENVSCDHGNNNRFTLDRQSIHNGFTVESRADILHAALARCVLSMIESTKPRGHGPRAFGEAAKPRGHGPRGQGNSSSPDHGSNIFSLSTNSRLTVD